MQNLKYLKSVFVTSSDIVAYRMILDLAVWNAIFFKFYRIGDWYKPKTRMKCKLNSFYKRIKIPYSFCPETLASRQSPLLKHIADVIRLGFLKELVHLNGHALSLESMIETKCPSSIATIMYEVY